MSRFYGTVHSSNFKTVASRRGHTDVNGHIRGWDSGVKVHGYKATDDSDVFQIYITSGSGDSRRDRYLGLVTIENNQTKFVPSTDINELTTK